MTVKIQKPINFINDCDCQVDYNLLEKAIMWYANKPTLSTKHIYLFGRYPAVSIFKEKVHVHRLLMMYISNRNLLRSEHVHHLDENRLNCLISNLKIVNAGKHTSSHLKGVKKPVGFGELVSESNKKRKGRKLKRRVNIPINELREYSNKGFSISKIARIYDCSWDTVKARIIENQEQLPKMQKNRPLSKDHKYKLSLSQRGRGLFGFTATFRKRQTPEACCWESQIRHNGHRKSLGLFIDPLSAGIVHDIVSNILIENPGLLGE